MPRFLDQVQLNRAIYNQTLTSLEGLAADPDRLDRTRRRFDADSPPAYASSTEDEFEEQPPAYAPPEGIGSNLPAAVAALVEPPLSEDKLRGLVGDVSQYYHPSHRFKKDFDFEEKRLLSFIHGRECTPETKSWLIRTAGTKRHEVLIRHYVKRKWQKLGVWNPEWGIPCRDSMNLHVGASYNPDLWLLKDQPFRWRWRWDQDPDNASEAELREPPALQAVLRRKGLRRGEHRPVPHHRSLSDDATRSDGRAFITSRPWFALMHELNEEGERFMFFCATRELMDYRTPNTYKIVVDRWKERGDWPDGSEKPGWKWRGESPSPEPEDLEELNTINLREQVYDGVDFTPSEIDALERIRTPSPPRISSPSSSCCLFPGPVGLFPNTRASPPAPSPSPPPPPRRRGRSRRRNAASLETEQPPLRRSPRIAARKAAQASSALAGAPPQEEGSSGAARKPARAAPRRRTRLTRAAPAGEDAATLTGAGPGRTAEEVDGRKGKAAGRQKNAAKSAQRGSAKQQGAPGRGAGGPRAVSPSKPTRTGRVSKRRKTTKK